MLIPIRLLSLTIIALSATAALKFNPNAKLKAVNLKDIVDTINADDESTWKADTYGHAELDLDHVQNMLGLKSRRDSSPASGESDIPSKLGRMSSYDSKTLSRLISRSAASDNLGKKEPKVGSGVFLPKSYDARQHYPNCPSISHIRDQSNCGSCWAVSAASVFSDRLCIHSNGEKNFELSAHFLLSCDASNYGCEGGYLDLAWYFLMRNGTVTGNDYLSDLGCQPYPIRPCGWPKKFPCADPYCLTPKCLKNKCSNEFHDFEYENYTFKVEEAYKVDDGFLGFYNEHYIKEEIILNGPVQVGFDVYADFLAYKSGVYQHKRGHGRYLGGHAVKIIGWGEEKGVPYWTVANSWGDDWGENGFVKFYRGGNNCGIEDEVYAGIPKI